MRNQIDIDLFDTDERIFINSVASDVPLSELSRLSFTSILDFSLSITGDDMVRDMVEGLKSKVSRFTDEEWDGMKLKLPFAVPYDAERNVDEVPAEEE